MPAGKMRVFIEAVQHCAERHLAHFVVVAPAFPIRHRLDIPLALARAEEDIASPGVRSAACRQSVLMRCRSSAIFF